MKFFSIYIPDAKTNPAHQPTGEESEIEIRQIFEIEDFGDAATPEVREQEARLRAQSADRH